MTKCGFCRGSCGRLRFLLCNIAQVLFTKGEKVVSNKMATPKLSIIIPVYNTEKYLSACLDSVVGQSWPNLEVIIVDDCTPDKAMEIAADYAARYPFIRIVHHSENKGLFCARITGMQAMTGDYFAFLDSDDSVTLDYYRPMLKKAVATGADMVAGDFIEVMESGEMFYPNRIFQQTEIDLKGAEILNFLIEQAGQDYGCHVVWNKIYSRHLYQDIAAFLNESQIRLTMCEDVLYSVLFYSVANRLVNVHGEYYNKYCRNPEIRIPGKHISYEKCCHSLQDIITAFNTMEQFLGQTAKSFSICQLNSWKDRIVDVWRDSAKRCRCTLAQRRKLNNLLKTANISGASSIPACELPIHSITVSDLPLQEIKNAIAQSECQYVSFDVFDTLLLRPFWFPTDLFAFIESDVTNILKTVDSVRFAGLRQEAERLAREYAIGINQSSIGEVTLDEIYQELGRLCPQLKPYAEQIKQLEIACELRFCSARKKARELVEFAQDMGKKVICVSDMYLSSQTIGQMLIRSGYTGIEQIFVSCEAGASKHLGSLYRYVQQKLNCKSSAFVHIGDNLESDVKQAQQAGWKAFHIPKVTDCMMNQVPGRQYGSLFVRLYRNNTGIRLTSAGFECFYGVRTLLAVVANRLYDDPFVPIDPDSDFNANPARIGCFAVGPYLLAIARWLAELCRSEKFDRINFVARDGWLPMQAFCAVKDAYGLESLLTDYVYVSRKTVMPLLLTTPECLTTIPWSSYNMQTFTPSKFVANVGDTCTSEGIRRLRQVAEQQKIAWDIPFGDNANFEKFLALFMATCYDKQKALQYSELVKAYYAPMFQGKTASFDIGYSCRSEVVFKRLFHFDISPCYLHINYDIASERSYTADLPLHCFYDYSPAVTGALREHLISYQGPSCTGFDCSSGKAVPVFEEYGTPFAARYVTTQMQSAALQYVQDMVAIFDSDLDRLYARRMDASWPMEYFLHHPRPADANLFNTIPFEDDMGAGRVTIRDFWQESLNSVRNHNNTPDGWDERLNYYAMSKPKKWLVWLLVDRKIMKDTAKRKLKSHPLLLKISASCYHGLKRIYHVFAK